VTKNGDGLSLDVRHRFMSPPFAVIPAQAGIHLWVFKLNMDSGPRALTRTRPE
jgi:hypothetical protein